MMSWSRFLDDAPYRRLGGFACVAVLVCLNGSAVAAPSSPEIEFFESRVRPLLFEHCFTCHGEKKQEGGLRLDSRESLLRGSDSGTVIVPGDPEKSKLVKSIRHEGNAKMPPKGKLPAEAIETLTAWIKAGAAYPASPSLKKEPTDVARLWGYQPLKTVPTPKGVSSPIDSFIGANGSKLASKRILIRRAYHDLIGLPPAADEIETFEKDTSADAYAKLIDRLLASPHYGETQARHWLDLARYSDTKGYVFLEDRNYPYAYTYRDWVVRAFNEDMPYDRFVQLQIAADRLPGVQPHDLAAMGFLTVGRRFLNNQADIIDDRLDVICRTFLGLTVTCARCHDHKYDPIPAKDYYSLYGVFASSLEPKDLPLIGDAPNTPAAVAFAKELDQKESDFRALNQKLFDAQLTKLRKPETIAAYLEAVRALQGVPNEKATAYLKERDLNLYVLNRWRDHLKNLETVNGRLPASKRSLSHFLFLMRFNALDIPIEDAEKILPRDDINKVRAARTKIDALKASSPFTPPRAMVLNDAPKPSEPYVFLRGNPNNRGPAVPRQFLEVLSGPSRKPFQDGSGRLELARAITDPKNPLTARVLVNRLWVIHFGQGLVRTPSDFGVRSDAPTHPDLLDWLAGEFMRSGWSMKKMHRLIMLSNVYQLSSEVTPEQAKADPENRLLARQNRRRVDFESLRDGMLLVSGQLDPTLGGKSVDLFKEPFTTRRTIYGFIDRQNLPGTFRIFDFASPDTHSPQRFTTTVPQQALFLMNSPFVIDLASKVLERSEVARHEDADAKINALFRTILARTPSRDDTALAISFLEATDEKVPANRWRHLAQVLLLSNEFAFID